MMTKISHALERYAKGWLILIFFGLFMLFNMFILQYLHQQIEIQAGDVGSIDLTFGAPAEAIFEKVAAYGEQGRALYRLTALTADVAYPIIYAIFLGLAITYFFRRVFPPDSWLQRLHLVPIAACVFDILENLGIVGLLSTYPERIDWLAGLTASLNVVKWILSGGSVVLVLIGLIARLVRRFAK